MKRIHIWPFIVPIIIALVISLGAIATAAPAHAESRCIVTPLRVDYGASGAMRSQRGDLWWPDGSMTRREDLDLRKLRDRDRPRSAPRKTLDDNRRKSKLPCWAPCPPQRRLCTSRQTTRLAELMATAAKLSVSRRDLARQKNASDRCHDNHQDCGCLYKIDHSKRGVPNNGTDDQRH